MFARTDCLGGVRRGRCRADGSGGEDCASCGARSGVLSAPQSLPQSDPRGARPPVHGHGDHQQGDRLGRGALPWSRQGAHFRRPPPSLQRQVSWSPRTVSL